MKWRAATTETVILGVLAVVLYFVTFGLSVLVGYMRGLPVDFEQPELER